MSWHQAWAYGVVLVCVGFVVLGIGWILELIAAERDLRILRRLERYEEEHGRSRVYDHEDLRDFD